MTHKQVKVAYNACYGGFSVSRDVILRAREISGDPNWGGVTTIGDVCEAGVVETRHYGFVDLPRHDPVLIQAIEEVGLDKASGNCAKIRLETLSEGDRYRIEEYDGNETVITDYSDMGWVIATNN